MDSSDTPKFSKPTAFLKNVSYSATEADVESFFQGLPITGIRISRDPRTGQSKGIVHVEFNDQESLEKALALNGSPIHGRSVTVDVARIIDKKAEGTSSAGASAFGSQGTSRFSMPAPAQAQTDQQVLTAYVSGLPPGTTEGDMDSFFNGIKIAKTRLYHDKETGEFKGVAFVEFSNTKDLEDAVARNGNTLGEFAINVSVSGKKQRGASSGNRYVQSTPAAFNNRQGYNNNNGRQFQNQGGRQNYQRVQDPEGFAAFGGGRARKPYTQRTSGEGNDQSQHATTASSTSSAATTTESGDAASSAARPKLNLQPRSVNAPLNAPAQPVKNVSLFQ